MSKSSTKVQVTEFVIKEAFSTQKNVFAEMISYKKVEYFFLLYRKIDFMSGCMIVNNGGGG